MRNVRRGAMKNLMPALGILGIFFLILPINAQTWIASKRLTWNSGGSENAAIAVVSSNNVHFVWEDYTSGNSEIYYKRSTNGGADWSGTTRLTWNPGYSASPEICVDSSDRVHVVWFDSTPGYDEILYRRSTDAGMTWEKIKRLTWSANGSRDPAIAVDSSDTIHLVWRINVPGNTEINYKRSTDGGVTWIGAKRLTWNLGYSGDPTIALNLGNTIHVVWDDDTPGNTEIYYRRSTNGGGAWGSVKRLTWNSGSSQRPKITVDSSDKVHVVWYDDTPGENEIYLKRSTNGGGAWASVKRLTWNSGNSLHPKICVDSSDRAHVVWYDYTPGNAEVFFKRSTNGGVNWSGAGRLTWNSGGSKHPVIAADSGNSLHVVWHDNTPSNYEMFYKKGSQ
jgi:hypothetical protein